MQTSHPVPVFAPPPALATQLARRVIALRLLQWVVVPLRSHLHRLCLLRGLPLPLPPRHRPVEPLPLLDLRVRLLGRTSCCSLAVRSLQTSQLRHRILAARSCLCPPIELPQAASLLVRAMKLSAHIRAPRYHQGVNDLCPPLEQRTCAACVCLCSCLHGRGRDGRAAECASVLLCPVSRELIKCSDIMMADASSDHHEKC